MLAEGVLPSDKSGNLINQVNVIVMIVRMQSRNIPGSSVTLPEDSYFNSDNSVAFLMPDSDKGFNEEVTNDRSPDWR